MLKKSKICTFNSFISHNQNRNTSGPRNSRTFYLRIRLFAVPKHIPNLNIREFISTSLAYMRFLINFKEKIVIDLIENIKINDFINSLIMKKALISSRYMVRLLHAKHGEIWC